MSNNETKNFSPIISKPQRAQKSPCRKLISLCFIKINGRQFNQKPLRGECAVANVYGSREYAIEQLNNVYLFARVSTLLTSYHDSNTNRAAAKKWKRQQQQYDEKCKYWINVQHEWIIGMIHKSRDCGGWKKWGQTVRFHCCFYHGRCSEFFDHVICEPSQWIWFNYGLYLHFASNSRTHHFIVTKHKANKIG